MGGNFSVRLAFRAAACGAVVLAAAAAEPAAAQLRIVDYNIAQNSEFNSDPTHLNTLLAAIAAQTVNGVARPIDIMANQELSEVRTGPGGPSVEAAFIVGQLNAVYGAGVYASAPIPDNAVTGGNGLPTLIYNTTTVTLLDTLAFGNVGSGNDQQPRSTMRYKLRPVGYDSAADFYIFNSHYKSDTGTIDQGRRLVEATAIRNNSDLLGEGTHALYVGDYNISGSGEAMYAKLLSAGPGQAVDPIDKSFVNGNTVNWSGNAAYKGIHTQSPTDDSDPNFPYFTGQVGGGMNDRFDFQLTTAELTDGEGMSVMSGAEASYRVFGNNNTHTMNAPISTGTWPGPPTAKDTAVLHALEVVSDHMPVVVDYQLPAKMQVQVASIPPTVALGAPVSVNVMVQNIASALVQAGADELDYTLSVMGDLIGGTTGLANPLASANTHQVTLNTSTPGLKSGTITVTASSQGAAGAMFTMPVSFLVGGGGGVVRTTIAKDDFDNPVNLNSFAQLPAATALTGSRGFREYDRSMIPNIPFVLIDQSLDGFAGDTQGIIQTHVKTDSWFGIVDTLDAGNPNATGLATATWQFNVAGASSLEVSVDMGAMGDFEPPGNGADSYNWFYALDGSAFAPLFTSSVDDLGSQNYTLADGELFPLVDPVSITNTANQTFKLSNILQTITSAIPGVGTTLTVKLEAITDGTAEAFAFDNVVVTGLVPSFAPADFDKDGFVDAGDLADWTANFGLASGATKAQGDADNDLDVDGADFLSWQQQFGLGSAAAAAGGVVPEPGAAALAIVALGAVGVRRRAGALPCGGPSGRG